jgi:hypothetical protein
MSNRQMKGIAQPELRTPVLKGKAMKKSKTDINLGSCANECGQTRRTDNVRKVVRGKTEGQPTYN